MSDLTRYVLTFVLASLLILIFGACCPKPLLMPDDAFRAAITAADVPPTMARGEKRQLRVEVKNASGTDWQTSGIDPGYLLRSSDDDNYRMYLGNHWLDANEKIAVNDDGRSPLPEVIKTGETTIVLIAVNAPPNPGEYVLELDLVQENITWFKQKGSPTARYRIKVE